jgi:hypothetical protein
LDAYDRAASSQTFEQVRHLPKLRMLRFFNSTCDDVGIKHLAGLAILEELTLNSTKVTDASIDDLAKLKLLRVLNIAGSQITSDGKPRLKKSLPTLQIVQ